MNTLWRKCGLGLVLGAVLTTPLWAQDARVGTFKRIDGQAQRITADGQTRPVQVGDGVFSQDQVRTEVRSYATMVLKDGTLLSLGPSSSLTLSRVSFDGTRHEGEMSLSMLTGMLRMVSGWLGKSQPQRVEIKTPDSVLGLRGTDFVLEVHP